MIRRRSVVAGLAASPLLFAPSIARAETASRAFRVLRDGDDIGTHTLDAALSADGFDITITIRLAVRVLGITAYRYELDVREKWAGGRLVALDTTANDDGDRFTVQARANGDELVIEGSAFSGTAPGATVTTSYYTTDFMPRRPWISTQTGRLMEIDTKAILGAPSPAWQVSGDLETRLTYNAGGEWTGCEFDAGGELARYEVTGGTGQIAALWAAA